MAVETPFPPFHDSFTPALRKQYEEDGFLAFNHALSPGEVGEVRSSISELIRSHAFNAELSTFQARDEADGTNYSGARFNSKTSDFYFQVEPGYTPSPDRLDELEAHVRKLTWFENEAPIFQHIALKHPRILPLLRELLGGEITIYQSMGLLKPPGGVMKPWHQDNAYFRVENLDLMVGVWIAIDEAAPDNGCMHVWKGGHRAGPLKHKHTTDCEILPDRLESANVVPVPLEPGGILIFHSTLPHFTPPNTSDQRRRALQFHYRAVQNPIISREAFDRIFVEPDGKPASCHAAMQDNF